MNLVCGESGRCVCRPDMAWSQASLQCELFLAGDCSEVAREQVEAGHRDILLSRTPYPPPSLQQQRILAIYCNVLEGSVLNSFIFQKTTIDKIGQRQKSQLTADLVI